jgi:Raf kinase inhibitor-like YbhB/YbcL family protein
MWIRSKSFGTGERIPERCAFGRPGRQEPMELAENLNPALEWGDLPDGTRSLVILCHDPDAPASPDDVNQEGKRIPADAPRADFFHWVLVDLDPASGAIEEGEFSRGVTAGGKPGPDAPRGTRAGLNDYTDFLAGDPEMKGEYFGYDGPCPPWNDEKAHVYHFTLYALDVPRCPVSGTFRGLEVKRAIAPHVLAEASLSGFYAINREVR